MENFENHSSLNENRSASFDIFGSKVCDLSLFFIRVGSDFRNMLIFTVE